MFYRLAFEAWTDLIKVLLQGLTLLIAYAGELKLRFVSMPAEVDVPIGLTFGKLDEQVFYDAQPSATMCKKEANWGLLR